MADLDGSSSQARAAAARTEGAASEGGASGGGSAPATAGTAAHPSFEPRRTAARARARGKAGPRGGARPRRGGAGAGEQEDDASMPSPRAGGPMRRVRTVKLATRVHPDALASYLYGERGARSMNGIMDSTGCTIDYCALSPGEMERAPQTHAYVINFLVSAETSEQMEDGVAQLRKLVDRVQVHLQKKARSRHASGGYTSVRSGEMEMQREEAVYTEGRETRERYSLVDESAGISSTRAGDPSHVDAKRRAMPSLPTASASPTAAQTSGSSTGDAASKRKAVSHHPDEIRWQERNAVIESRADEAWGAPSIQRVYYSSGGRRFRREQPRYTEVVDVDSDEKSGFEPSQRPVKRVTVDATSAEFAFRQQQRGEPAAHFVTRRRVRRRPEHARFAPRGYSSRNDEYVMYPAGAQPDAGENHATRLARSRQAPRQFRDFTPGTARFEDARFEDEEMRTPPALRSPRGFVDPGFSASQQQSNQYGDEIEDDEDGNDRFSEYDEVVDLTREGVGVVGPSEYRRLPDQQQSLQHGRPGTHRGFKRPLGTMRGDTSPATSIYHPQVPYIYEYVDDEDDEWISGDDDLALAYGYPAHYQRLDAIPHGMRRRRRYGSVGSAVNVQQWGSPAGLDRRRVFKRRRVPYYELPLEEATVEVPSDDQAIPSALAPEEMQTRASEPMEEEENLRDTSSRNVDNSIAAASGSDAMAAIREGVCSGDDTPSGEEAPVFPDPESDDADRHGKATAGVVSVTVRESTAALDPEVSQRTTGDAAVQDHEMEERSDPAAGVPKSEESVPSPSVVDQGNVQSSTLSTGPASGTPVNTSTERSTDTTSVSAAGTPPASSAATISSPSKRPTRSPEEEKGRVASPLASADPTAVAPELNEDSQADGNLANRIAREQVEESLGSSFDGNAPTHTSNAVQNQEPSVVSTVTNPPASARIVNDTVRINDQVISSLEKMNSVEADYVTVKQELAAQETKFRAMEGDRKCRRQLEVLCGVIYDLQCRMESRPNGLDHPLKNEILTHLDSLLGDLFTTERTLQEKVGVLRIGLERVLVMGGLLTTAHSATPDSSDEPAERQDVENADTEEPPPKSSGARVSGAGEEGQTSWEDDGWFEDAASLDPANESEEEETLVSQISPKDSNLKLEGEFFAVKREEGSSRHCPQELPSFVWSFLAQLVASGPQSYVMRVTHKRLLEEISNCNPYYYLHPTNLSSNSSASSTPTPTPPVCEFGCRGASAVKWERKLVSQISSRMKSFDNVAYSLARSSGGKEVLNRKKMNSIIRKLHLVAMQLHSLVSHLYCVKGQTTCKEVDSLPIALNNSHFERKMGVYKSRLKLVVPHKYQHHQQQHSQRNGSNEPTEELLRDTYEFFPELLLCVDIWGYNYREGHVKRRVAENDSVASRPRTGPDATENAVFPLGFFREVESRAFDFEHDGNGLLRRICDELLNIVCLWNDFKWTDNLDSVALECIVSFETDVTASILKILELHAHHLQAVWAVRLLDNPERLRGVHFTQLNAYYSDRSRGGLTPSAGLPVRAAVSTKSASPNVVRRDNEMEIAADEARAMAIDDSVNQRCVEEYWTRKSEALSLHREGDHEMEETDASLLSVEEISSWDQSKLNSCLLRWSDVYAARTELNTLSSVTQRMLTHEVQRLPSMGDNDTVDEADFYKVDVAAGHLLAVINRAQILSSDAVTASEKLALHFASNQLPSEKKHAVRPDDGVVAGTPKNTVQPTISSSSTENPSGDCAPVARTRSSTARNAAASGDKQGGKEQGATSAVEEKQESASNSGSDDKDVSGDDKDERGKDTDAGKDVVMAAADEPLEQPELKDLIQLLAVTKHEMEELCSHRPRSARVREKLQTQSVELARQAVEIFRNITSMYAAQRR